MDPQQQNQNQNPNQYQQPPQPIYPPQQQPMQQQQPGYPPQQQQQQMYPQQPPSAPAATNGPNIKKLLIIAGVFLVSITVIALIASSLGGGSTSSEPAPTSVVDDSQVGFTVAMPDTWQTSVVGTPTLDLITATAPNNDFSIITAVRDKATQSEEAFFESLEVNTRLLEDEALTSVSGTVASDIRSERIDGPLGPGMRTTYTSTSTEDESKTYAVMTESYHLADQTSVIFTAQLAPEDTSLQGTIAAIVESFTLR